MYQPRPDIIRGDHALGMRIGPQGLMLTMQGTQGRSGSIQLHAFPRKFVEAAESALLDYSRAIWERQYQFQICISDIVIATFGTFTAQTDGKIRLTGQVLAPAQHFRGDAFPFFLEFRPEELRACIRIINDILTQ